MMRLAIVTAAHDVARTGEPDREVVNVAIVDLQELVDVRARLATVLRRVAVKRTVDDALCIARPSNVTFTLSARQRADGRSRSPFASLPSPKPVTRRGMIVARIMLPYACLYAIGGFVYDLHDLPIHELAAFGMALRALTRFAQQRDYRRHLRRLQLSNVPDATMTFDFDEAGVRMSGDTNATHAWNEIRSVEYREGLYRVNVPHCEALLIPRTAFPDEGLRFKHFVEAKFVDTYMLRKPSQGTSVLVNARYRRRT